MRALIDHGDFYRAAVADGGNHDHRLDKQWWPERDMGWPVGPEYRAQSNIEDARSIKRPLLLAVGGMDRNVDPASTMQLVDALVAAAHQELELVVLPGERHYLEDNDYFKRRRARFFVDAWSTCSAGQANQALTTVS